MASIDKSFAALTILSVKIATIFIFVQAVLEQLRLLRRRILTVLDRADAKSATSFSTAQMMAARHVVKSGFRRLNKARESLAGNPLPSILAGLENLPQPYDPPDADDTTWKIARV